MDKFKEHDVVETIVASNEVPEGSVGAIVHIHPDKMNFEVEFSFGVYTLNSSVLEHVISGFNFRF